MERFGYPVGVRSDRKGKKTLTHVSCRIEWKDEGKEGWRLTGPLGRVSDKPWVECVVGRRHTDDRWEGVLENEGSPAGILKRTNQQFP